MEYKRHDTTPEERAALRGSRMRARLERRRRRRRRILTALLSAALLLVGVTALSAAVRSFRASRQPAVPVMAKAPRPAADPWLAPAAANGTVKLWDEVKSGFAVVVDPDSGEILGGKAAHAEIPPASMTKILTLLTASESIKDLDDTFVMTKRITDLCFVQGCSVVGFTAGETVPVRDLLYGTILPSGADAALGLACYTAGSHEAFVARMNEKLEALGLSKTAHFTNCVGWHDDDHRCTVLDIAVILDAALRDDLCREVLTTYIYATSPAGEEFPEGRELSNWFLRRIEDHMPEGVTIEAAKTGYTSRAGSCAASSAVTADGRRLIVVTGNAPGTWPCIYDHAALYRMFG